MATTFVKIASVTVGSGGSSTIDFTSIPQTYTDLLLVMSARTNRSATQDAVNVRLNGATTNFSYRNLIGTGSSASSANEANSIALRANGATATANIFSNGQYYLPNYTSSNYKSYSTENVIEDNATASTLNMYAGLWSNTSAVTSITLVPDVGSFVQYSSATLYGIKSS